MRITNYNKIKDSIKKYSHSVDFNLNRAGWVELFYDSNISGRSSKEIILQYHKTSKNFNSSKYLYRRYTGDCGLPLLRVYIYIKEGKKS